MLELKYYAGKIEAGCDEAGRGCLAGPVYAAAVILPDDIETRCPELAAGLNDSKQLTEKKRYDLRPLIEENAVAWAVGVCDNKEIDKWNILRCSILAMHRALDLLKVQPEAIIVDGNRFAEWRAAAPLPSPPPARLCRFARQCRRKGWEQNGDVDEKAHCEDKKSQRDGEYLRGKQLSIREFCPPTDSGRIPYSTIVKGDGKYLSIAAASILAKTYRDDCMKALHEEYPMYHWDGNKGYPAKVHREAIRQHGTSPYHRMSFNLLGESQQLEFQFD